MGKLEVTTVTEKTSVKIKAKSHSKIVVFGDVHVPFQDEDAVEMFLTIAKSAKPDAIISCGDFVDFYAISRHLRTPQRRLLLAEEIRQAKILLQRIKSTFPKAVRIFMCGNHEYRLRSYIYSKAVELVGLPELELERLLGLEDWIFLDYQDYPQPINNDTAPTVYLGNLIIQHGARMGISGNAVNTARCIFLRTLRNILCFHWHHFSQYLQMDYTGSIRGAWVLPCLALPRPHYDNARIFAQGFGVIELYPDESFRVIPIIFINKDGMLIASYEGKQYEVKRRSLT